MSGFINSNEVSTSRQRKSANEKDKPRQGVVAITLTSLRNGAVGFIDWLGVTIPHAEMA